MKGAWWKGREKEGGESPALMGFIPGFCLARVLFLSLPFPTFPVLSCPVLSRCLTTESYFSILYWSCSLHTHTLTLTCWRWFYCSLAASPHTTPLHFTSHPASPSPYPPTRHIFLLVLVYSSFLLHVTSHFSLPPLAKMPYITYAQPYIHAYLIHTTFIHTGHFLLYNSTFLFHS